MNIPDRNQPKPRAERMAAERGSAVLIVFVVVAIVLVLTLGNSRTVTALDKELKLIEKRQVQRWSKVAPSRPRPAGVPVAPVSPP